VAAEAGAVQVEARAIDARDMPSLGSGGATRDQRFNLHAAQ